MAQGVTRRSFLASAGVAALGAAAVGFAGCAPQEGSVEPVQAEMQQGRWSWSNPPDPIPDSEIVEQMDCEVLVIGFGSAGAPAALYASSMGASTIVMTKRDTVEANGAWVGSWNSKHDADFGLVYDPLHWRQFIANNTNGRGNPRIYGNIIDKSGEVLDWLTDYMDDVCQSEYKTDLQWGAGISDTHLCIAWPDPDGAGDTEGLYSGFPKLMQAIVDRIEENGATILYETPAVQLVTDDSGAVVAAIGQTSKG